MILEARNNNEFTAKTATKGEKRERGRESGHRPVTDRPSDHRPSPAPATVHGGRKGIVAVEQSWWRQGMVLVASVKGQVGRWFG